jgi:hypothetical protein
MTQRTWMKESCGPCPFSRSKTLPLHPERAEEFASMTGNPYTDFPCHKTADYEEETEWREGGFVHGARSFTCNGFLSMRVNELGDGPEGFKPHPDAFEDWWEMVDHHAELWAQQQPARRE